MLRIVLVMSLALGGCNLGPLGGPDTAGWEKNWLETTCEDWLTRMTPDEQRAFGRFSLNESRRNTLASAPDAPEGLVTSFTGTIGITCVDPMFQPSDRIVAVAAVVYSFEDAYKPDYR